MLLGFLWHVAQWDREDNSIVTSFCRYSNEGAVDLSENADDDPEPFRVFRAYPGFFGTIREDAKTA